MLNVGGGELLVIFLVALIVLGPQKLPEAARQMGRAMSELRRMSQGFQREMKAAMDASVEDEARARGDALTQRTSPRPATDHAEAGRGSPADLAGMYDLSTPPIAAEGDDGSASGSVSADEEVDE
jgi:Tat protein translocase TatB subunit